MGAIGSIFSGGGGGGSVSSPYEDTQEERNRATQLKETQAKQKALQDSSAQYRSSLGDTQQQMANTGEDTSRRGLATKMTSIDKGANQRGLLYSGLKQGAQADAGTQYASDLAAQRQNINTQTNNTANQMDDRSIESGFTTQKLAQQMADEDYQRELRRRNAIQGRSEGVGGLIGQVAGTAIGGVP